MYRGWTQADYQNKHYNIKQKDEGTLDDRGRDGGTNFILKIKEQETRLTLQEHDDDDDDDEDTQLFISLYHRHRFYLSHPDEALPCSSTPRSVYRMRSMDLIEAGTLCIFHSLLLRNRSWVTEWSRPKRCGRL